jgi:hypothetical protein
MQRSLRWLVTGYLYATSWTPPTVVRGLAA